jgi:hypothetical protein
MVSQNLDYRAGATYLNQIRNGTKKTGKFYTLEALLRNHQYYEASDPRDMIYALQGIAQKENKPFTTHGYLLVADYTVLVETLYTRVTRIMIQSNRDLGFLLHREGTRWRSINGVPS